MIFLVSIVDYFYMEIANSARGLRIIIQRRLIIIYISNNHLAVMRLAEAMA